MTVPTCGWYWPASVWHSEMRISLHAQCSYVPCGRCGAKPRNCADNTLNIAAVSYTAKFETRELLAATCMHAAPSSYHRLHRCCIRKCWLKQAWTGLSLFWASTCSECFAKLLCTCAKQIAQLAKLVGVAVQSTCTVQTICKWSQMLADFNMQISSSGISAIK